MIRPALIDHIVLRVRDEGAMVAFYIDVLGCTLERRRDDLGLVQLRAGGSLIDLVQVEGKLGRQGGEAPGPERRNLDHFCLRIDPWDGNAVRAFLLARGCRPGDIALRFGAQGEGESIYVDDPEGNVVELKGPRAAEGAGDSNVPSAEQKPFSSA